MAKKTMQALSNIWLQLGAKVMRWPAILLSKKRVIIIRVTLKPNKRFKIPRLILGISRFAQWISTMRFL